MGFWRWRRDAAGWTGAPRTGAAEGRGPPHDAGPHRSQPPENGRASAKFPAHIMRPARCARAAKGPGRSFNPPSRDGHLGGARRILDIHSVDGSLWSPPQSTTRTVLKNQITALYNRSVQGQRNLRLIFPLSSASTESEKSNFRRWKTSCSWPSSFLLESQDVAR